jgi:hypothetical protein
MATSQPENTALRVSPYYPFNLTGPLCPLLNDSEVLLAFYSDAGFRQGIKGFCKRTAWAGKPPISFAIDPEKLKALVVSLFNSPEAREKFAKRGDDGHCPLLHNAIWQWSSTANPTLVQRFSAVCVEVKDRLYIKDEALKKLLGEIQKEQPAPAALNQLAYVVLAFAMLQPDDRFSLGETFLSFFPEYANKFSVA